MIETRPVYRVYQLLWTGLDWLFPPHCGGCSKLGRRWCENCQKNSRALSHPLCPKCGDPQPRPGYCSRCVSNPPPFAAVRSWAAYEGNVKNAIIRLKYQRDIGLGDALSQPLAEFLQSLNWQVDIVVPVPLSKRRLKARGYNQVALLAFPLSLSLGLPYQPAALSRVRETKSQVDLTREERRINVMDAFAAQGETVSGRSILLMDDVLTTGSTLESASQALLVGDARQVFGLTLARTINP